MNLTRTSWPLGWTPANDEVNGLPGGLLRADNLELDELGVLSLSNAEQKLNSSPFSGEVIQIFSKVINNTKYRYVVLSNGIVLRSSDNFASTVEVVSGASFTRVGFASVLGQNLICAGDIRIKDDGTTIRQLGLKKPDNPPIKIDTPTNEVLLGPNYADWTAEYGTLYPPTASYDAIANYTAIATNNYWGINVYEKSLDLSSVGLNPGSDEDIFSFFLSAVYGGTYINVKIEVILQEPGSPTYPETDLYYYEWKEADGVELVATDTGYAGGKTFSVKRGDFLRSGTNPNLDWSKVARIKLIGVMGASGIMYFKDFKLTSSFLVGKSYYYATMNVANLGTYVAKSPLSDKSEVIAPTGGQIKIQADNPLAGEDADPQINEVWFFRRASGLVDVTPVGQAPMLDTWYRVGVNKVSEGLILVDKLTDEDALTLNIKADVTLISVKDIKDEIIGIVSGYYDRTLYLTSREIYISERLNPDSIAALSTIKLEGGNISKNLWITKSSLGVVLVGTTQDIFEISGTLADLPDGSIDVYIKPLSVPYPPISYEYDIFSNAVYYMAKDGIRALQPGGSCELVTGGQLDLLFQGESRHGIPPVNVQPKGIEKYPIAITQTHLFASLSFQDGTRNIIDWNFSTKTWQFRIGNPISFCVEEDGVILAGYGGSGIDNYIREFNKGKLIDGVTGQTIRFLTIFDDNQQPRNRKDVFTLKITADSGNQDIDIWVGTKEDGFHYFGKYKFNGLEEKLITLGDVLQLREGYALKLEGYWLDTFKLENFTIEYEPRPEQLTYLRIPNNNLGTLSRKRVTNYAFVIDTLGNSITFTPLLDGVSFSNSNVNFDGKRTHIHYFTSETIGTDIGGILRGGTFEYYGLNLEEIVSEKLPVPVKYLVIPATDYGVPNRKRHSSYKFQINTRGYNVRFTPRLDGVNKTPLTISTSEKRTVEYFFTTDTIAIDIGGTLESLQDEEFEFYGVIKPQEIEVLPARLKEFRIPENNYEIAARKRIRTMPMEINTNGYNVTFTPIIDGVMGTPSVLNSATRKTLFHYFETDVFGTDFSGELVGTQPFEFYKLLKPEEVEILPVGKKLDQIGPLRFDKIGKLLFCRFRAIAQGSETIQIKFYDEDGLSYGTAIHTENVNLIADKDEVYEFAFPKTVKSSILRIVIGPSVLPFHRYDMQLKVNFAGMDSEPKWIKVK